MTDTANNKPETSKAYAAFMQYCGLGPSRSLAKLAEHNGKNTSYIRQLELWSSSYNWVKRVKEFDKQQLEQRAQEDYARRQKEEAERQATLKEMRDRHAKSAQDLQNRVIKHLEAQIDSGDIGSLPAVNLLKLVYDTEARARGEVDRVELTGKDGGPIVIKTTWGTPKIDRSKNSDE